MEQYEAAFWSYHERVNEMSRAILEQRSVVLEDNACDIFGTILFLVAIGLVVLLSLNDREERIGKERKEAAEKLLFLPREETEAVTEEDFSSHKRRIEKELRMDMAIAEAKRLLEEDNISVEGIMEDKTTTPELENDEIKNDRDGKPDTQQPEIQKDETKKEEVQGKTPKIDLLTMPLWQPRRRNNRFSHLCW